MARRNPAGQWDDEEQPRCGNCGCRRIFHYKLVAYRFQRRAVEHEEMVPCTRWINEDYDRCGCVQYHALTVDDLFGVLRHYYETGRV